jgi:toxin FitB
VSYLADTNVVSELVKPNLDANVARWFSTTDEDEIWLSVMTFTEIRFGIETMADGRRKAFLLEWLENELPVRFEGRIIAIGAVVADACGRFIARSQRMGRTLEVVDGLVAATAEIHRMTLVTRNTKDFERLGIELLNPWYGSH